jgi:hypothetical protein
MFIYDYFPEWNSITGICIIALFTYIFSSIVATLLTPYVTGATDIEGKVR